MKARVKATGEIMEFSEIIHLSNDDKETKFEPEDLEFLDSPKDEPDYWEKLKHQAAITAMQGLLSNSLYLQRLIVTSIEDVSLADDVTMCAYDYATTLINKLKEESQCEK